MTDSEFLRDKQVRREIWKMFFWKGKKVRNVLFLIFHILILFDTRSSTYKYSLKHNLLFCIMHYNESLK